MANRKPIVNYHSSGIVYYLTSGDTLCASNFSATTVTAKKSLAVNYLKLGSRYFIATLAEPYSFTVATLNALASGTSGVNATTLGKGSILYLASWGAPASNLWMKMHTVSTASWLNLTSGGKI